jgi:hypothetical protein
MAVVAILMGREGSTGFSGKNLYPVLGRPLVEYPLLAARESDSIDRIYVTTDSRGIMTIGREFGAEIIQRPPELCTEDALGEDVFVHAYDAIKEGLSRQHKAPEIVVLLMANAATVTASILEEGIEMLRADPTLDSAVTVSRYNMWSPLRARRLGDDGCLHPFVPFEAFGNPDSLDCDRDSQGDVYFADMGASVVRPRCLEHLEEGLLPQKWMGKRIAPIFSWGGCDVDYEWQIPLVEHWLRANGVSPATAS